MWVRGRDIREAFLPSLAFCGGIKTGALLCKREKKREKISENGALGWDSTHMYRTGDDLDHIHMAGETKERQEDSQRGATDLIATSHSFTAPSSPCAKQRGGRVENARNQGNFQESRDRAKSEMGRKKGKARDCIIIAIPPQSALRRIKARHPQNL